MKTVLQFLYCLCLLFITQGLSAQAIYSRYRIVFTDKNGTPYSLDNPGQYLSPRAILRRQRYGIKLDSTDLPIVPRYIDSVLASGQVTLLNHSNWLNQIIIRTTDTAALARIRAFPFVRSGDSIALRMGSSQVGAPGNKFRRESTLQRVIPEGAYRISSLNYGASYNQIHLHNGDFLHNKGLLGQGMVIAMLDGGFSDINTNPAFDSLLLQHRLLGTWNYVYDTSYVFGYHWHGANCLSIIAANLPGQMIGAAPDASFWLMITEDVRSEQPVEEDNWAAGAEKADSAGADIISSSLGYSLFDNPAYNLSYADLNGTTADVSRAASLAVKKGMIVVNAAGNEGETSWKYIITPADGIDVLAVGAVDIHKQIAPFSSYGPTADGRISPVVASVGWNTVLVDTAGVVSEGSGTSYATPNMAGLVACLWQGFPAMSNYQIMAAVEKSADHYTDPGDQIGYGIPDFEAAYDTLLREQQDSLSLQAAAILDSGYLKAFPNPFLTGFTIVCRLPQPGPGVFSLYDTQGRLVYRSSIQTDPGLSYYTVTWGNLDRLPGGVYFLKMDNGPFTRTIKLVKSG